MLYDSAPTYQAVVTLHAPAALMAARLGDAARQLERQYADLFVRVCDVDAQGVSRNVVDGFRRLSPQTVPAPDVRAGNDGILEVDVELYPTAYRVRAGHRLRVQVSGRAFPRFARSLGTPEPFGVATRARRCRFDIYYDSQHPSHVVLPVLPDR